MKSILIRNVDELKEIGDVCFQKINGIIESMTFYCPCGCGHNGWVGLSDSIIKEQRWSWNGSEDKPTLSPSILQLTCGWHGHLTNGEFVSY